MNRLSIAFVTLLTLIAFSCTDMGETTVSPVEPDLLQSQRDNAEACHDIMQFICCEQVIFYAENGWYASSLEELDLSGLHALNANWSTFWKAMPEHLPSIAPFPQTPPTEALSTE